MPHQGLNFDEPLLFDLPQESCGVDLPPPPKVKDRLGGVARLNPPALPNLSEPRVIRHFTRLSQKNFSIDSGFYPLGSCTMKHNPRLNEQTARLPGFANIHPLQAIDTVPGAVALMGELSDFLKNLTGLNHVALSPAAGAHGELCGMLTIRVALHHHGHHEKTVVLVPESAHGTNPATAAACGFTVRNLPADDRGRLDLQAFYETLTDDVAAIMLTNPNTCGLFEDDIVTMAKALHAKGAYVYCDGANFNALAGVVRPGDLGVDAMHINLHKTFSTPHGGGGPGSGPVVFSKALAPFVPLPWVLKDQNGYQMISAPTNKAAHATGRIKAFWGQFATFVRALTYMKSFGTTGIAQASKDAVLNANYIRAGLSDIFTPSFAGPCMHEVLFDESSLKPLGLTTMDVAKGLIDKGFHPMTVYFPLVVQGAMLIEPTESESQQTLDDFMAALRDVVAMSPESLKNAPEHTPRRRLDEVRAARTPVLTARARA
ncbi:MAG: aminomethyl-transferring glycine dehydrogenase subunit GcvPB [Alphaproteobacteria bacterium]